MASISKDRSGSRRLLFTDAAGDRKAIYLGKTPQKTCESLRRLVEQLVAAKMAGTAPTSEAIRWLDGIGDAMRDKLAAAGVADAPNRAAIREFVESYIAARVDVKPNTLRGWRQARDHLVAHFGPGKPVRSFTKGDGKDFRLYLIGLGLAEASVRKYCGFAKHFLAQAVDREILDRNPFAGVPSSSIGNEKRQFFVTRADTQKVFDACPDAEWRLIVALSRYGGLRCPSEHLRLAWDDIDWERSRFTVHSPKTERHQGHDTRIVPLFPELRPFLADAFDAAEEGATHVLAKHRDDEANIRTQMTRIVRRAGLKPWPRIFHNLRSSRQTELEAQFPTHVVCSWIGNSPLVARRHYLQMRDEDFDRAALTPTGEVVNSAAGRDDAQSSAATVRNSPQRSETRASFVPENKENHLFQGVKAGADGNRTHRTSVYDVPPVLKTGTVTRAAFTPEVGWTVYADPAREDSPGEIT